MRLLNEDKEMLGVFGLEDAIQQAEDVGLDVVLISPDADPPVCRMMDASRHKYELDKKDKEAKKKQREARYECSGKTEKILKCQSWMLHEDEIFTKS